jgi:hypothetical protein
VEEGGESMRVDTPHDVVRKICGRESNGAGVGAFFQNVVKRRVCPHCWWGVRQGEEKEP